MVGFVWFSLFMSFLLTSVPSSWLVKELFYKTSRQRSELEERIDVYAVDRALPDVERILRILGRPQRPPAMRRSPFSPWRSPVSDPRTCRMDGDLGQQVLGCRHGSATTTIRHSPPSPAHQVVWLGLHHITVVHNWGLYGRKTGGDFGQNGRNRRF